MFSRANDAIQLVNRYNSSLLSNVSFIFNFAKSGAYGVYLSALDRAIKTKVLQKLNLIERYQLYLPLVLLAQQILLCLMPPLIM
jgi:hypothetical protein